MPTYVALLRAVNVGGRNKVSMSTLRSVVESLGHRDVRTYIQSGNVVFTSTKSAKEVTPASIERAIEKKFGLDIDVILRSTAAMKRVVKANPFSAADLSKVHVGFMAAKPKAATISKLEPDAFDPEAFAVKGSEVYFFLPNGMGRTKLPGHVLSRLDIPTTVRTWSTVLKLLELAGG